MKLYQVKGGMKDRAGNISDRGISDFCLSAELAYSTWKRCLNNYHRPNPGDYEEYETIERETDEFDLFGVLSFNVGGEVYVKGVYASFEEAMQRAVRNNQDSNNDECYIQPVMYGEAIDGYSPILVV